MVELKALAKLEDVHLSQSMNYCEAYNLPIGLLLNFGARSLEFRRVYNVKHPDNQQYMNTRKPARHSADKTPPNPLQS